MLDLEEFCNKLDQKGIRYRFQDRDHLLVFGRFIVTSSGVIMDTRRKRRRTNATEMFTEIARVMKKNEREGGGFQ